eukprot:jgi/Undpi1/13762/HiC_scaffold_9.g03413.m1
MSSVVLTGGCSVGLALRRRLSDLGGGGGGGTLKVRSSPVLDSWNELVDAHCDDLALGLEILSLFLPRVCRGADIVYVLSALELPDLPDAADLQDFRAGVSRVVQCCQECGVGGLVFVSSSRVVSSRNGLDLSDENVPFVTSQEDETAHAIALAEAENYEARLASDVGKGASNSSKDAGVAELMAALNALSLGVKEATAGVVDSEIETQNIGGSSCLYTCALRPASIYGTKDDRSLQRALGWVGWGLNRVALGRENVQSDMLYIDNLVEAQVLAGRKLMEGAADAQAGGAGWSTHAPVCSGQAYFVTDGRPCNLQAFADGVLDGLDFPTSKIVRVPKMVALAMAGAAELICKVGLTKTPVWTRKEVRTLTEDRTSSIARIRADLGYEPIVDPGTALRSTVEGLKGAGWGRHTFLVPGLGYCILIPLFLWFLTIASFESTCPAFLAPVQRASLHVHLAVFRRLVLVRVTLVAAVLAHVLEGVYAYTRAQRAGHKDTAPLWLIQTTIIGFPSTRLVMRLLS